MFASRLDTALTAILLLLVHPKFTFLLGCLWSSPGFLGVKKLYGAKKLNMGEIFNKIKPKAKSTTCTRDSLWESDEGKR